MGTPRSSQRGGDWGFKMRPLKATLLACAAVFCAGPFVEAGAHGDWPSRHGGIMNLGGETSFELVQVPAGLHFYPSDHGEPLSANGARATLTVRRQSGVFSHAAVPEGGRRLFVPGVRLRQGDQASLKVTFQNGSVAVGRFTP